MLGTGTGNRVEVAGSVLGPMGRLRNALITSWWWKLEALHCPVAKETDSLHRDETQDTVPKGKKTEKTLLILVWLLSGYKWVSSADLHQMKI